MTASHIMCTTKVFTDLCFSKQRIKKKKCFCKSCLQCFSSKNVLIYYKEVCLNINGAQTIKFEKRTIKIKNAFN